MELEIKGGGTISKDLYYIIGGVLEKYSEGKNELSRHRCRAAKNIYSMYKTYDEVDDGVTIRDVARKTCRRTWVSKILGGRGCYDKPMR